MKIPFINRRTWRIGLIIFGAYTALLLVNMPSVYYSNAQRPQPTEWWTLTASFAWGMYIWVFITPFILLAGSRFRIARPHLWRNVFIHFLVGITVGLVRPVIENLGLWAMGMVTFESFQAAFSNPGNLIRSITGAIVTYPSVLGIQQAYFYFRESQERAFRLQQAELEMLKMQLHPHFFFNTLNAISALMYRSPKEADRMIIQLGDLFRVALKKDKTQEVSLKEELDFLKVFLQIHKTLMGKRLKTEWKIAPETLDAQVPNMILQPIAENSIKHGLAPLEAGGQMTISAERQNGHLLLQVTDDGQGFVVQKNGKSEGIGLSNTKTRLANLYGDRQKFSINELPDGGVTVKIEIPFRE